MVHRVCVLGDELGVASRSYAVVLRESLEAHNVEVRNWSRAEAAAMKYIMDDTEQFNIWLQEGRSGGAQLWVVVAVGLNDRLNAPDVLEMALEVCVQTVVNNDAKCILLGFTGDDLEKQIASSNGAVLVEPPHGVKKKIKSAVQQRQLPQLDADDHQQLGQALVNALRGELGLGSEMLGQSRSSKKGDMIGSRHGGHGGRAGSMDALPDIGGLPSAFDGFWVHKDDPGQMEVIDNGQIRHQRDGSVTALRPTGVDSFAITVKGREVRARMVGDELHFETGEIWTLVEDQDSSTLLEEAPFRRTKAAFSSLDDMGRVGGERHDVLDALERSGFSVRQLRQPLLEAIERAEKACARTHKESQRCWQGVEALRQEVEEERRDLEERKRRLLDNQALLQQRLDEVSELRAEVQRNAGKKGCC